MSTVVAGAHQTLVISFVMISKKILLVILVCFQLNVSCKFVFFLLNFHIMVASATTDTNIFLDILGSIPGSDSIIGFFHLEFISSSHGVWIYARFMAIGSPPITWDLKT